MSEKKAVFFDIDGTLWDVNNEIPESTIRAIRALRENGHLTFLCSGRSRAFIRDPRLFDIGFDGVVSGCGTMVEYCGKTIFYKQIDNSLIEQTIQTVRTYGFRPILEGRNYLYMSDQESHQDDFWKKMKAELGESLLTIENEWGNWEASKLTCVADVSKDARKHCLEKLERYYDYMIHSFNVIEMVPKGYNKGKGIEKVCDILEMNISDTFAFGDSANDIAMLRDAGIGVAMGNGSEEVKAAADYVTTSMKENGIWNACKHFELI